MLSPIDVLSICVCLMTILWCVRVAPKRSRSPQMLLGVLGVICALLTTRALDAVISILFLGAAVVIEIIDLAGAEKTSRQERDSGP